MKRPRPYIPIAIRIKVAVRQMAARGWVPTGATTRLPLKERLQSTLRGLFGDEKYELLHRPALINRPFNRRTGKYTPDANDPAHLVYLEKHEHHVETNVRGIGAQRSDTAARMHQRRMDENRGRRKRRPKAKIAGRPFASDSRAKTRKWAKRPFRSARP